MEVVPFSNYFAFESSLSLAIAEGERGGEHHKSCRR